VPRPHQPILSREIICRAALDLMDRTGRFTLPELAQRLGVSVSSIYHHVQGRDDIVEGIRGLVMGPSTPIVAGASWAEAVTRWARSYRDAFAAHPAAIPALLRHTVSEPAILAQYDALAAVLEEAGFTPDATVLAITMLDNLCIGAALDLAAPSVVWAVDDRSSALGRALSGAPSDRDRQERAFELQLSLVVDGLARQLSAESALAGGRAT
jgi:AcrR family transcriptional regulator